MKSAWQARDIQDAHDLVPSQMIFHVMDLSSILK